jgi:hypothetical protein
MDAVGFGNARPGSGSAGQRLHGRLDLLHGAEVGMLAVMRSLSGPLSLIWRFFWTSSMMRMASIGGLGTNCSAASNGHRS